MKVKDCIGCRFCKRFTGSHSYTSASGRRVDMTHAYRDCGYYYMRCAEVESCEYGKRSDFYPNADEDGMVDVSDYPYTK